MVDLQITTTSRFTSTYVLFLHAGDGSTGRHRRVRYFPIFFRIPRPFPSPSLSRWLTPTPQFEIRKTTHPTIPSPSLFYPHRSLWFEGPSHIPPISSSFGISTPRGPTLFILNVVQRNVDGNGTDLKGRLILVDLAGYPSSLLLKFLSNLKTAIFRYFFSITPSFILVIKSVCILSQCSDFVC